MPGNAHRGFSDELTSRISQLGVAVQRAECPYWAGDAGGVYISLTQMYATGFQTRPGDVLAYDDTPLNTSKAIDVPADQREWWTVDELQAELERCLRVAAAQRHRAAAADSLAALREISTWAAKFVRPVIRPRAIRPVMASRVAAGRPRARRAAGAHRALADPSPSGGDDPSSGSRGADAPPAGLRLAHHLIQLGALIRRVARWIGARR